MKKLSLANINYPKVKRTVLSHLEEIKKQAGIERDDITVRFLHENEEVPKAIAQNRYTREMNSLFIEDCKDFKIDIYSGGILNTFGYRITSEDFESALIEVLACQVYKINDDLAKIGTHGINFDLYAAIGSKSPEDIEADKFASDYMKSIGRKPHNDIMKGIMKRAAINGIIGSGIGIAAGLAIGKAIKKRRMEK